MNREQNPAQSGSSGTPEEGLKLLVELGSDQMMRLDRTEFMIGEAGSLVNQMELIDREICKRAQSGAKDEDILSTLYDALAFAKAETEKARRALECGVPRAIELAQSLVGDVTALNRNFVLANLSTLASDQHFAELLECVNNGQKSLTVETKIFNQIEATLKLTLVEVEELAIQGLREKGQFGKLPVSGSLTIREFEREGFGDLARALHSAYFQAQRAQESIRDILSAKQALIDGSSNIVVLQLRIGALNQSIEDRLACSSSLGEKWADLNELASAHLEVAESMLDLSSQCFSSQVRECVRLGVAIPEPLTISVERDAEFFHRSDEALHRQTKEVRVAILAEHQQYLRYVSKAISEITDILTRSGGFFLTESVFSPDFIENAQLRLTGLYSSYLNGSDSAANISPREENLSRWPHIRWMIRRDMPAVLAIEEACFEFPWSEEEFVRCLRQRNCIGMVAERDDQVVGFMVYELCKNRFHLLNFAVDPALHRQGIATTMIERLWNKLSNERRNRIMLEVRETNMDAQLFFRSRGFRAISVLRDFYEDTKEDAYLMEIRYRETDEQTDIERIPG